ncbi:MAG: hypothetical protein HQK84_12225 [Nitrospinae bacterium]|nr:hypothetical protein [Nitrospinota bacterium]
MSNLKAECIMCGHRDKTGFLNTDIVQKYRCASCGRVECVNCLKKQGKTRSGFFRKIAKVSTVGVATWFWDPTDAKCPYCSSKMIQI